MPPHSRRHRAARPGGSDVPRHRPAASPTTRTTRPAGRTGPHAPRASTPASDPGYRPSQTIHREHRPLWRAPDRPGVNATTPRPRPRVRAAPYSGDTTKPTTGSLCDTNTTGSTRRAHRTLNEPRQPTTLRDHLHRRRHLHRIHRQPHRHGHRTGRPIPINLRRVVGPESGPGIHQRLAQIGLISKPTLNAAAIVFVFDGLDPPICDGTKSTSTSPFSYSPGTSVGGPDPPSSRRNTEPSAVPASGSSTTYTPVAARTSAVASFSPVCASATVTTPCLTCTTLTACALPSRRWKITGTSTPTRTLRTYCSDPAKPATHRAFPPSVSTNQTGSRSSPVAPATNCRPNLRDLWNATQASRQFTRKCLSPEK